MCTMWQRFGVLEGHAALNGFVIDYAAARQNSRDCWFIATDVQLRRRGFELPDGWTMLVWRRKSRQWMVDRQAQFNRFGEDY